MTVFIIETFFVGHLNDQMFILQMFQSVINLLRVCGIHAIIARTPDLFKCHDACYSSLPPGVIRSEANERQKGLIMGDAGHARVSRGGSFEMLGKQKLIWMMIRQPSCRLAYERMISEY